MKILKSITLKNKLKIKIIIFNNFKFKNEKVKILKY